MRSLLTRRSHSLIFRHIICRFSEPIHCTSTNDLFVSITTVIKEEVRSQCEEIWMLRHEMGSKVTKLRDDVGILRANSRDLYIKVVVLRGFVASRQGGDGEVGRPVSNGLPVLETE